MKKALKRIGLALLVLLIGFVLIKWEKLKLSYHAIQSSKLENRLKYIQEGQKYFPSRLISKSSKPQGLKISDTLIDLPDSFYSVDTLIFTKSYLEYMRYEGLLVLKDGEIVYENYWNGLKKNETHAVYSISKSIMSIGIGAAINEGLIGSKDDLVIKYLPQFKDTWYKDVSIDDCLDMVSGIKWENDLPMAGEFMWKWGWGLTSAEEFLLKSEAWHEPGEKMVYNSMDPLMVGLVLKSVIGNRTISEYIQEKLWEPLGAEDNAYFQYLDKSDIELTWAGIHATMRDLAKIGQLYLQEGNWNGNQIVSKDWVNQTFNPHRETTMPIVDYSKKWFYDTFGWGYNNFWWIPDDTNGDEIFAWGIFGQTIYINRKNNVVVVSFRSNPLDGKRLPSKIANRGMVEFMQAISASIE